MLLSVASGLARLGKDPWVEAGRLAQLPRDTATEALAALIVEMSPAPMTPSDVPGIAARLILLLPSGAPSSSADWVKPADPRRGWPNALILLLCVALLAFASFNLFVDRGPASDAPHATGATSAP